MNFSLIRVKGPWRCWKWVGHRSKGYGRAYSKGKLDIVHRMVFELLIGPIPEGHDLDHLCRHKWCAHPNHVEPVTRSVNTKRGKSPLTVNQHALKTHCPKGHAYTQKNTYVTTTKYGGRGRACRVCAKLRMRSRSSDG